MCKSYHSTGFCPYGTRCHFIHNAEDIEKDSSEEDSLDVKPFEGLKIRYAIEHSTLEMISSSLIPFKKLSVLPLI